MAYNEDEENRLRLRHFFFPGLLFFAIESLLATILLITLNLSSIGNTLLYNNIDKSDPVSFTKAVVSHLWDLTNQLDLFRNVSLFILWALAGALAYLLVFRLFQIIYVLVYSAEDASKFVKKYSVYGLIFWFMSLNAFFKSAIIKLSGTILLFLGTFICFGFASNQLRTGLTESFPASLTPYLISLIIAIFGMRILVSGIGLLVPAFRSWYYS